MYLWLVFTIVNPVALFPNAEADSSSSYKVQFLCRASETGPVMSKVGALSQGC
jgi:hypothetical protein